MGAFLQYRTSEKKNSLALLLSLISMNNNVFLTLKEFSTSILYKGKGTYIYTHSMSRLMSRIEEGIMRRKFVL